MEFIYHHSIFAVPLVSTVRGVKGTVPQFTVPFEEVVATLGNIS